MQIMTPPDTRPSRRPALVAATMAIVALAVVPPRAEAQVRPPHVPANIEVPYGNRPFLVGHAYGTQGYVCLLGVGGFAWTFFGPQATLFSDGGQQLITHFLSPNPDENATLRATWQDSRDTSAVWAAAVADSVDPAFVMPGASPWLLLQSVGLEAGPTGGTTLAATTFVQRVNTNGGKSPAAKSCARVGDIGRKALVPYTADYVFYKN